MTTAAHPGLAPTAGLADRWTDVFRRDGAVHVLLMASIVAGTFQGYLKDRIAGPVPYALADLCFVTAVVIWFGSLAVRHAPIRGPGAVPMTIVLLVAVPTLFLLHPGTPLVIELAGLRAWAAYPVACLVALTVVKSRGQVRAYVGLIIALCVITAAYGIRQYQVGPEVALGISELAEIRHAQSVFYSITGGGPQDFRAYSTFTFPAPFAMMMVFGILLAAGLVVAGEVRRVTRWLLMALVPLFFLGMTVSGTRAAVIILGVGLLILGWYRGLSVRQLLLVPVAVFALHAASLLTAGRALERWQSVLLEERRLWTSVAAPISIATRALESEPFGLGLGRSGVGVPFQLYRAQPAGFFVGSDGDIGRAAVELGVFGILLLLLIVVVLLPYGARVMRALRNTPSFGLALGIGALVLSATVVLLIGSPLSTAPHGVIWWFLFGAVLKLWLLEAAPPPAERSWR